MYPFPIIQWTSISDTEPFWEALTWICKGYVLYSFISSNYKCSKTAVNMVLVIWVLHWGVGEAFWWLVTALSTKLPFKMFFYETVMAYEAFLYGHGGPYMLVFVASPVTAKLYRNTLLIWVAPSLALTVVPLTGHQTEIMKVNVWDLSGGVLCLLSRKVSYFSVREFLRKCSFLACLNVQF